ncbi:hypothetical protein DIURU_003769 [Diutina rugosa]|uniref:Uncharacterized protein n=1 Tax=Diutina rugosa TaxID=5481 RepID=A0A642URM0_DIURU|nr:uncharacterized protein DIURU_003769 [Diutina rugosa]KAA8900471.1 hypothetical protein DIURU_003769 [Diutina rugosa]
MIHIVRDPVLLSEHSYYDNGEYRPHLNFDITPHGGISDDYSTQVVSPVSAVVVVAAVGLALSGAYKVYRYLARAKPVPSASLV